MYEVYIKLRLYIYVHDFAPFSLNKSMYTCVYSLYNWDNTYMLHTHAHATLNLNLSIYIYTVQLFSTQKESTTQYKRAHLFYKTHSTDLLFGLDSINECSEVFVWY